MSAVWDCERARWPAGRKDNENDSKHDRPGTRQHEFDVRTDAGARDAGAGRIARETGRGFPREAREEAREESEERDGSGCEHDRDSGRGFAGHSGGCAREEVVRP